MRNLVVPVLVLGLVACAPVRAQFSAIQGLAGSVYDRVGVTVGRVQETAGHVTVRPKRLTALLGSANALYSSQYNKLLLDGSLFDAAGRVKDLPTLTRDLGSFYEAANVAGTVYHELGHAEWDVLIEEGGDAEDQRFYAIVRNEIVPWIEANEKDVDKPWLCVQEWHGYYMGNLLSMILSDYHDLLFYNGIDPASGSVTEMSRMLVRATVADGLSPDRFGTLVPEVVRGSLPETMDRSYDERMRGYDIYVSNGLIDGQVRVDTRTWTAARGFKDEWWSALWRLVVAHYGIQPTPRDLLNFISYRSADALAQLRTVQESFAGSGHAAAGPVDPTPGRPMDLLGTSTP